jgi:hypothetical protein
MNRNIGLGLGIVVGIFTMLLFFRSNIPAESFGRSFPIQKFHLPKLLKRIDSHLGGGFKARKNFKIQPAVTSTRVPEECL